MHSMIFGLILAAESEPLTKSAAQGDADGPDQ
eukprot:CAMPEP_0175834542 /NCGR_PEP_ID=MMETSP0107_2-20121207/16111_1 /TAXON_ID=195067 ORGANISM="Goniomonas pacifica, Strain CCMP1869" /NCGR_SAMPLE_ID=MMETSP0107_2 /ASSEMBLY_ACC=CAM_ASM_000203 /LENGTH=31 /DNA_ID= /DNA_START= /DNA_END= /DNA_ORIENTATION=